MFAAATASQTAASTTMASVAVSEVDAATTLAASTFLLATAPALASAAQHQDAAAPPSFAKTISMNNLAAQHLEHGDYEKAIKAFTLAFYSFRKAYHQLSAQQHQQQQEEEQTSTTAPQPHSQDPLHHCTDAMFFKAPRRKFHRQYSNNTTSSTSSKPVMKEVHHSENAATEAAMVSSACCCSSYNDEEQDDDSDYEITLYCNAIHLPPDFPITKESCGFFSTAITFNLALANHLYGMELQEQPYMSTDSLKHLKSAGRLYEYTMRLERARAMQLTNSSSSNNQQPLFVSPLVLMCVLNNLGHLHTLLSNTLLSHKCFSQLQTAVVCWMHTKQQQNDSCRDLMQCFMENCLVALQQVHRNTAAAA